MGRTTSRCAVRSFVEERDAERAALNARGVTEVDNRLTGEPTRWPPCSRFAELAVAQSTEAAAKAFLPGPGAVCGDTLHQT